MKKIISFFVVIALFAVMNLQTANATFTPGYTFSSLSGLTYDTMTTGTKVTTVTGGSVDDGYLQITLPWTFNYNGSPFTQVTAGTNGWLAMGAITSTSLTATNLFNSGLPNNVIAGWWRDNNLNTGNGGMWKHGEIIVGADTIYVVEWRNVASASNGGTSATLRIGFEVYLYKTSGRIEIRYGAAGVGIVTSSSIGIEDIETGVAPHFYNAVAGGSTTLQTLSSAWVGSGNGYRFDPIVPVANDVGIVAGIFGTPNQIISVGKGYNVKAVMKNFGTNSQNSVPIYYDVNGAGTVGPVNSSITPTPQNGTDTVLFSGGNAFTAISAGTYTIRIWTLLASDQHPVGNDTMTIVLNVRAKINTFPYLETFSTPKTNSGYTFLTEVAAGNTTPIYRFNRCTNVNGVANDSCVEALFNGPTTPGREILRSPEFDLTGVSNPVLHFYLASRSWSASFKNDTLEVLVSTDGGVNFFSATTVYKKWRDSSPSLCTGADQSSDYVPSNANQWRHETISLLNVANISNVVIGWRGITNNGNNAWIDNVIVTDASSLCTETISALSTPYNCSGSSLVTLNFSSFSNAAPLPPPISRQELSDNIGNIKYAGVDNDYSNIVDASTTGGGSWVTGHFNNDAGGVGIKNNTGGGGTGATNGNGNVIEPSVVYQDFWYTVTYSGNDANSYSTYDIEIDLDGSVFTIPGDLYIVKRTDATGLWICQNTTLSGNKLKATGLTRFSDFGIAGQEALPVELSSFVSIVNERDVILNWTTASEINNSGFDVERSSNGVWTTVANVAGNGTSATSHSYSFTDRNLASGKYNYRLKQIDFNGNFEYFNLSNEVNIGIPVKYDLSQNYPNPFNPSTTISYDLPFDSKVNIKLFDMSGREVFTLVNEVKTAGYYTVNFNASNLSSGVYFYRISAEGNGNNFVSTKKMMLVK